MYDYKIVGGFSAKQKMTSVKIDRHPSESVYKEIEKILHRRFRKYAIGKIIHVSDGIGTIVIDFNEVNAPYQGPSGRAYRMRQ